MTPGGDTPSRPAALVTGASAGLGAAYAEALARRGFDLLLVARRAERLDVVADRCRAHGVQAATLVADLATVPGRAACRAATDTVDLRMAVLNAGFGSTGPMHRQDPEREVRMVDLNCAAVVDLAAHVLPRFAARGSGDLVILSSAAAFLPLPAMATYAATRAFTLHLARALAVEHTGGGVRVLAVCPGPTRTEFSEVITRERARGGGEDTRRGWPLGLDDPDAVVERSLAALERGRVVVTTGWVARTTRIAASFVPYGLVATAIGLWNRRRGAGSRSPI